MRSLCIDDIQKINPTDFRLEKFFEIFNHRYSEDKHTVVTTDTKPEDLKAKYGKIGEAIVSRIGEWCLKIEMQEKFR